jgi:TRAP-type C4-dicarboxylate transport system permease small subunit
MWFVDRFCYVTTVGFGIAMVAFAVLVTFETIARKFFGMSLQGVDELGGYVLAATSSLAFTLALVDRAHIRIDLFHLMLPQPARALLNWLSTVLLAAFAVLIVYVAAIVVTETVEFNSTAPTPWATPLVWPQSVWFAALFVFLVFALGMALHATRLLVRGRWAELDRRHGPKGTQEELQEELEDLRRR